ncbi:MFS transporter [Herbaspirillum sp. SJZ107]|uniref:MFS transporter n=1 Tax=Herbaspirillum sp. SJZ107 TaxID=2572881 RepID=UPI001153E407|nr:MFS transporter [Herbaspirillum sp. SJZ107]TQK07010.1 MFS transporter [Herbaspirillum sp. SJZ107]
MDADQNTPRLSGVAVFFYVFLPFALGHYLSSLLRNVNAVLAPQLVGALALTPGQLGLLTSAFFFAFALVQLPVGIALDRYGPRKVQLVLMLLAAGGAWMFATGHSFTQLVLARAIIGCGLGGCFMSAVKAISTWIAPKRLPSVQGYLIAVGGLGAASSTMPVRSLLQYTDWRGLFMLLAFLTVFSGLLIWLVTPRNRIAASARAPTVRSVLDVYRAPAFRTTISLVLIPHAVFFGIQGLWIGRWLSDVARFPDSAVAYLLYLGMASVIFGAIAVGMITEWAGRRGIAAIDVAAVGVALFLLVQLAIVCNYRPSLQTLSVLFTLVGTITGIEYAIVAQSLPRELTGRAATCLNLLIFVGAFLVQAGFGQIVGLWQVDGAGHAPAIAYRIAFGVLLALQLPGLLRHCHRTFLERRPVECGIALLNEKEDYEIGSLRSPR